MSGLSRRKFIQLAGAGAVAAVAPSLARGQNAPRQRPNFVFILVDDMGYADTAVYGSEYYETPNIDRLASEGMKFTNGYAACAVCSPTRASIMTGRYPARLGVTDWIRARFQGGDIPEDHEPPSGFVGGKNRKLLCPENALWLDLDEITIAEMLKRAGYATCHIGKWHLGTDPWYPEHQGFDQNIGGCDFGQPPSYFDPYENKNQGRIPTLQPREKGEYLTDRESEEATKFIREHQDEPFFLYMAHYAVHMPIQAKKDLIAKYREKEPSNGQDNAAYAAMIESVDDAVGAIMKALDETGQAENTVLIFTSDNGGHVRVTNNIPLRSGKGFPYEGGIREPVIVRWPGVVEPGSVNDVPMTSVDYFPTMCEIVGLDPPSDRAIDGVSIVPALKGARTLGRDDLFWHFPHYRGSLGPYSIIRSGDWKLIRRYDSGKRELYNLKRDIGERNDLAEEMPGKVAALDKKLDAWLKKTNAKMPKPNPDYESPEEKK